jgi:hypothetical protein
MKVKELIEELSRYDENLVVVFYEHSIISGSHVRDFKITDIRTDSRKKCEPYVILDWNGDVLTDDKIKDVEG